MTFEFQLVKYQQYNQFIGKMSFSDKTQIVIFRTKKTFYSILNEFHFNVEGVSRSKS